MQPLDTRPNDRCTSWLSVLLARLRSDAEKYVYDDLTTTTKNNPKPKKPKPLFIRCPLLRRHTSLYPASQVLCCFFFKTNWSLVAKLYQICRHPFSNSICSLCLCGPFWEFLRYFKLFRWDDYDLLWAQMMLCIFFFFSNKAFLN